MSDNIIKSIQQKAIFLNKLYTDENALFDYVNNNKENLEDVLHIYKPTNEFRPVNTLRFLIANEVEKGNIVTSETIKNLKEAIESRDVSAYYELNDSVKQSLASYKNSTIGMFPNWRHNFKILFPFIHSVKENNNVKSHLDQLVDSIIEANDLKNVNKHIVTFQGSNNYGSDRVWNAIFPESSPSVQYAFQLFFAIEKSGFVGGVHKGHNLTQSDFDNQDLKFDNWQDFVDHTKSKKEEWMKLNSDIDFLLLNDEKEFRKSLKKIDSSSLIHYFQILDRLKVDLNIQDEEKLVFSVAGGRLSFQVGKRICLKVNKKLFDFISYNEIQDHEVSDVENFTASSDAYYYKNKGVEEVYENYQEILSAVANEIERDNNALAKPYDNSAFRKAFFDRHYRMKFMNGQSDIKEIFLNGEKVFKISMGKDYFTDEIIEKAINERLVLVHSKTKPKGRSKVSQADIFTNTIKNGDFFYLTHSNKNVKLIGRIISDAQPASFNEMYEEGWLERGFEIIKLADEGGSFNGDSKYWAPNTNVTCWEIESTEMEEANKVLFKPFFHSEFKVLSIESTPLIRNGYNPSLNQIFYGPPGTGKTYHTILEAAKIITRDELITYDDALGLFNEELGQRIEFITFHQNYSYEDFIQGLRPDTNVSGELSFHKSDGVFKRIADKALKNLNDSKNPAAAKKEFKTVFNEFIEPLNDGDQDEIEVKMKQTSFYITDVGEKSIEFRKNQGDSKHTLSIGTLQKMYDKGSNDIILGGLQPYYNPVLKLLLEKGKTDVEPVKKQNYVIIIDEINRANISRVFGELITLIEEDKRSHGKIPLTATLPSGDKFIVPSNLYIIGTMNTADKSIALLDIALRRRFQFVPMYPDSTSVGDKIVYDAIYMDAINKEIITRKGYDFTIGHSYFMGENYSLKNTVDNKVIPLLLEYFMNDFEEVKKILSAADLQVDGWPMQLTVND